MKNKTSDTLVARNDYSKRPWKYEDGALRGSDGSIVSEDMHVLDAILTVRAVNSYESQFKLIEKFGDAVTDMFEQMEKSNWTDDYHHDVKLNVAMLALIPLVKEAIKLRKAIAEAEGEKS